MTIGFTVSAFAADGDPPVRGALHHVADSREALVLTHGAGSDHRAPMLVAIANAFARSGVTVLRCDLAFRHTRPSGPPSPSTAERDRRGLANAIEALRPYGTRRFVGGHSYGGRQASMLLAESTQAADALLLLSYPLHPPGRPLHARTAHFEHIVVPTLFVHGSRDPFGAPQDIEQARSLIRAPTMLITVPGAPHSLPAGDAALMDDIVAAFKRLVAEPLSSR
jgi:predicted alpha/beta-hydrolase family hydrolase